MSGKRQGLIAALAFIIASSGMTAIGHADVELKVGRFFDPCIDINVSIDQANDEACIVQAIFDAFSREDNGITVDLLPYHRDSYYPELIAGYSAGTPPEVHLLHRHRLRDFAGAGMLAPLGDDLAASGVDVGDWEPSVLDAVTIDDRILAVPFDLHANLWHLNLALFRQAGLIDGNGRARLPASPGELLDQARRLKEATGKDYLAADFVQFPIGLRSILSLVWQQDQAILDGQTVRVDTAEMRAAISTFTALFDAGLADPDHDYERAQQAFLNGEVAVLINGTWAVDLYDRLVARADVALADYDVADFPTLFDKPATWADLHLWAVPASLKTERPEAYAAALELLAWINDHNLAWARTGHLAVRRSVLGNEAYQTMAHRPDYQESVKHGQDIEVASSYDDVQIALINNLKAIWQDDRPLDHALAEAQESIQRLVE